MAMNSVFRRSTVRSSLSISAEFVTLCLDLLALLGARLLKKQRDPAQAEEIREQMERQAFHLSRLIEDLTDISRIGQGKISLGLRGSTSRRS
jgi:signal transduction histidine kinase